jgi:uncharacterized membrane protein YvbJ
MGLESTFTKLQNKLESAAFLVSKGGAEKEAHSEIMQGLILVSELRASCIQSNHTNITEASSNGDKQEIVKVQSRLRLWAKRQNQINSKILNAFLKLEKEQPSGVTEHDLKNELSDIASFDSNFSQMKIIADRNHGKIFDQFGDKITLWKPVISYVREYQKITSN